MDDSLFGMWIIIIISIRLLDVRKRCARMNDQAILVSRFAGLNSRFRMINCPLCMEYSIASMSAYQSINSVY